MKQLLYLLFSFVVYLSVVDQLGFSAFNDVLDNGMLTYIAGGLGLASGPGVRLLQKWRHHKSANLLIEYPPDTTPFHFKVLNFPLIVLLATFFWVIVIGVSNHKLAASEIEIKPLRVMGMGSEITRNSESYYVTLSDGQFETDFNLGQDNRKVYSTGRRYRVKVRRGLWGYDIIERILP